jgi:hypothetical protein
MPKIVIAGSASLQDRISYWKTYWQEQGWEVLDLPKAIPLDRFDELYPDIYRNFFHSLGQTDRLFVMNEDKNGLTGYIGAETFAELCYVVANNRLEKNRVEVVLLKKPDPKVQCCQEIELWLKLGWINLL